MKGKKGKKQKNPSAVHLGHLGGKARLTKLTAAQRREIATKAAHARWAKLATEKSNEEES